MEQEGNIRASLPVDEFRVVILGEARVGRSQILGRLMNDGGMPREEIDWATQGIVIKNRSYPLDQRQIRVNFWDMGDQKTLMTAHRLFLTSRTFYVVVVGNRTPSLENRIKGWLGHIRSVAPGAPVMVVVNELDQDRRTEVNEVSLQDFCPELTRIVSLPVRTVGREDFNREVTLAMLEEMRRNASLAQTWPDSWIQVRERLEHVTDPYITGRVLRTMCWECGVQEDPRTLMQRFNEVGAGVSVPERESLDPQVIFQPAWITNALGAVFSIPPGSGRNGQIPLKVIRECLRNAGALSIPDTADDDDVVRELLNVMRKAELSFGVGGDMEFIPALCRQGKPEELDVYRNDPEALEVRAEFDFLPDALVHQLMVRRRGQLVPDVVWQTGACFRDREYRCYAVVAGVGTSVHFFIKSDDPAHAPTYRYLEALWDDVRQIAEEMDLALRGRVLTYKLNGIREQFDLDDVASCAERGMNQIYSASHRRIFLAWDILNQRRPNEAGNEKKLLYAISEACLEIRQKSRVPSQGERSFLMDLIGRKLKDQGYFVDLNRRDEFESIEIIPKADGIMASVGMVDLGRDMENISPWDEHLSAFLRANRREMATLFLTAFVRCREDAYEALWTRFSHHISRYSPSRGELMPGSYGEEQGGRQGLKVARCRYFVNGMEVTVYHLLVMLPASDGILDPDANTTGIGSRVSPTGGGKDASRTSAKRPPKPTRGGWFRSLWERYANQERKPRQDPSVRRECRVVFLGDSEAGKSLIMSRIEDPAMDPAGFHGNTTIGINIFARTENIGDQSVRINYWDFGGQEILHSMHRMFLSRLSVYVIVLNTRNDNQDAQANFWLRYVEAYAAGAPVMLVLNKIDQNKRATLNLPVLRRQFGRHLDERNVVKISAIDKDPQVFQREFKEKLLAYIGESPECIHSFNSVEAQIRDEVEQKREKVFSPYEFIGICAHKDITAQTDQIELMRRFNEAGIMVSFGVKNPMFLNPKWITSSLYRVLDQGEGIADNGVISHVQLGMICAGNPARWCGYEDAEFLVRIMYDYGLAFSCDIGSGDTDNYLIPMLCRREEPGLIQNLIRRDNPVEMRMVFEYLPSGVLYRVMAKHQEKLDKRSIWLTGVKIDEEDGSYVILRQEENTMAIYVHCRSRATAVERLEALANDISDIAQREKFYARLEETRISYTVSDVKEYFDYQQLLNARQGDVQFVTSTRKEHRDYGNKPPKIPVLDILDQDEGRQAREQEQLLYLVHKGCMDVQKDPIFWNVDENARNRQLARVLRESFVAKDQPQSGISESGHGPGELDVEILDTRDIPIAILEALNTTSMNTENWRKHLNKLMDNYNVNGLRYLFLVSYVKCAKAKFREKFLETASQWQSIVPSGYESAPEGISRVTLKDSVELISITRADYLRNGFTASIFHFIVHIGDVDDA